MARSSHPSENNPHCSPTCPLLSVSLPSPRCPHWVRQPPIPQFDAVKMCLRLAYLEMGSWVSSDGSCEKNRKSMTLESPPVRRVEINMED